jgi:ribosomal-protein-alanine N-acetyltransferase
LQEITLREATEDDLQATHMIENMVYPAPWTLNFFRVMFHMNRDLFLVAVCKDEVIGYSVGEIEKMGKVSSPKKAGHVLNIAVREEFQGRGVGTMMLDELEKRFMDGGADIAYLEVRESNNRAQQIYRNRGYRYVRTVEDYYGNEDGYIMTKSLDL